MKFLEVAKLFEKIDKISSRNEITEVTAEFLKGCDKNEFQILSYIMLGRVAPLFVNAEFNYSEKSLLNLLSKYTHEDLVDIRKRMGDIGDTVEQVWRKYSAKTSTYSVSEIYEVLWKIINTKGTGSIQEKGGIILECLKKLSPLESKYFVRIICGSLRLGANARSLLDVYSVYLAGDKSLRDVIEHAYGTCTDIGYIAGVVAGENAVEKLSNIDITPGTPVLSRLVERVGSFEEAWKRFSESVLVQPKFDGLRCQIHKWSSKEDTMLIETIWSRYIESAVPAVMLFEDPKTDVNVKLFTRNLEDVTEMFPEIVESAKSIPVESFILDSEVLGWDYSRNKFLSYQETMQRRRKYSVREKRESIPVKAFAFDILYMDQKSLVLADTKERIEILGREFKNVKESIEVAESKVVSTLEELRGYFDKSVRQGLEGIIVKKFKGGYRAGVRNYEWIKIKKSIDKELVDTVDMVIVGFDYGSGRRSDLGIGAIWCGILNEKSGTVDMISKVGTGLNDEMLKRISSNLSEIKEEKIPKNVRCSSTSSPDVWVTPKYVVTVDADEITKNISNNDKEIGGGLSLRFPRLVEFDRDKLLEDITTVAELESMYKMRKEKSHQSA